MYDCFRLCLYSCYMCFILLCFVVAIPDDVFDLLYCVYIVFIWLNIMLFLYGASLRMCMSVF